MSATEIVGDGAGFAREEVVVIETEREKWRFRCPRGHTSWTTTNNHIFCVACSRQHDRDPEHFELLDQITGEMVPRNRIDLRL